MPPLQTIINEVFPTLLPAINQQNALPFPVIDVFSALGGANESQFPPRGCSTQDMGSIPECKFHCGPDPAPRGNVSCDNCHPCSYGYGILAATVKAAIER